MEVRSLLALKLGFATEVREEFGKRLGPGNLVEGLVDGLRQAGLNIAEDGR